jgi:putative transposase
MAFRHVMEIRPFSIDAIVILPDHLHCIWQLPEGDNNFPERWRQIKRFVSIGLKSTLNERNEKDLWQRRYWEHLIKDEEDWRRHIDYIHYNPVKHGYVERPADWPYSSFKIAMKRDWYEATWGDSEPPNIVMMKFE